MGVIIKSINNCFYDKLKIEYFLEAHQRSSKCKKYKKDILLFELDLESNIINLINDIRNDNYHLSKYKEFIIYEPKKRIIRTLEYKDRVVQQWYVHEFIKPYFVKRFISDSYACIIGRGTHNAVKKVQLYLKKMDNCYVIKCDIKKYFESIDKDILFEIVSSKMRDKRLINFTRKIIYENNNFTGICIGNYSSQYFANIYLNELDYYLKHELKIKYYVRYMDDFVLLVKNKEEAKEIYKKIEIFVNSKLHLELNKKSCYFPSNKGIDFCGYIIFKDYLLLRKRCKNKIKKKVRMWNRLYKEKRLNKKRFILSYNSFLGHIKHSNSYNFRKNIEKKIEFLLKNSIKG